MFVLSSYIKHTLFDIINSCFHYFFSTWEWMNEWKVDVFYFFLRHFSFLLLISLVNEQQNKSNYIDNDGTIVLKRGNEKCIEWMCVKASQSIYLFLLFKKSFTYSGLDVLLPWLKAVQIFFQIQTWTYTLHTVWEPYYSWFWFVHIYTDSFREQYNLSWTHFVMDLS